MTNTAVSYSGRTPRRGGDEESKWLEPPGIVQCTTLCSGPHVRQTCCPYRYVWENKA